MRHGAELAEAGVCANCGATVPKRFCGRCGQERRPPRLSVGEFLRDYLTDILGVEARLWRTLVLLVRRPGQVTAEYLAGKRVRFTPPLKLYLAVSAVFFGSLVLTRPADQAFWGLPREDMFGDVQAWARGLLFGVPLFALGLRVLYPRSRRLFIEHLVFLLYAGTVGLLLALPLLGAATAYKLAFGRAELAPAGALGHILALYGAGVLVFGAHLALALGRVYADRLGWAALRAAVLIIAVAVLVGLVPTFARGLW